MKQKPFVTLVVAIIVLGAAIGGAFAGGIAIGRNQGREDVGNDWQAQFEERFGMGASQQGEVQHEGGPFGDAFGGFRGGGGTAGTVDQVGDNTITVETPQGTVQVIVDGDTLIQKMGDVGLDSILPGERVTVSGEATDDGSIQATSIFVTPGFQSP